MIAHFYSNHDKRVLAQFPSAMAHRDQDIECHRDERAKRRECSQTPFTTDPERSQGASTLPSFQLIRSDWPQHIKV